MAIKDNDYDDSLTAMINDPMFAKLLRNMLMQGDEERGAMEMEQAIDPLNRMDQFRNEAYRPGGTGKVHFMGGSPFPQSSGQERGENVFAIGSALGNVLGTGGVQNLGASLRDNAWPAIVDAWRNRKKPQGGQG